MSFINDITFACAVIGVFAFGIAGFFIWIEIKKARK